MKIGVEPTNEGFLKKRTLSSSDNLNNVKEIGWYTVTTAPTNSPANAQYYSLLVLPISSRFDGLAGMVQVILVADTIYLRAYAGSPLAWRAWYKFTGAVVS